MESGVRKTGRRPYARSVGTNGAGRHTAGGQTTGRTRPSNSVAAAAVSRAPAFTRRRHRGGNRAAAFLNPLSVRPLIGFLTPAVLRSVGLEEGYLLAIHRRFGRSKPSPDVLRSRSPTVSRAAARWWRVVDSDAQGLALRTTMRLLPCSHRLLLRPRGAGDVGKSCWLAERRVIGATDRYSARTSSSTSSRCRYRIRARLAPRGGDTHALAAIGINCSRRRRNSRLDSECDLGVSARTAIHARAQRARISRSRRASSDRRVRLLTEATSSLPRGRRPHRRR